MTGISLTSSMRNNLLSLQQTAKLQDITQNRLATGLKVNSAIDNPSSYYTAQSLNNRAEDLYVLLDAMSQGIQTLKAVNESIEAGTKFLEQAKSVANSVLEPAQPVIAKVSTEEELLAAVNSRKKGLIVLENDITMSTNQNIVLNDGQSLVGARYFDKDAAQTKLSFDFSSMGGDNAIVVGNDSLVAGLAINFISGYIGYENTQFTAAVYADGVKNVRVRDVAINVASISITPGFFGVYGVMAVNGADLTIEGKNKIELSGYRAVGVFAHQKSNIDIKGQIDMSFNDEDGPWGIWTHTQSTVNIYSGAAVNAITSETPNITIISNSNAFVNVFKGASLSAISSAPSNGLQVVVNEFGTEAADYKNGNGIFIEKGVNVSVKHSTNGVDFGGITTADILINQKRQGLANPEDEPDHYMRTGTAQTYEAVVKERKSLESLSKQFNQILSQYDQLVNDSWYKGVNLLKQQDLKVIFNESRSSDLDIKGVHATTKGLGLETTDWNSADGVQNSLNQIDSAINQLRLFASEFGNYYQIVTTRENFTNALINVLTEGADALTLADMNQEGANMLALQTRQQLAVNSLSLASQASQSVLRLF